MTTKVHHFIIGDIHGGMDQLGRLEKKINRHCHKRGLTPVIISCGDLIDRGPQSQQVLEHFYRGHKKKTHQFVLGNHELMMLEVIEAYRPDLFKGLTLPPWFQSLREAYESDGGLDPDQSFSEFRDGIRWGWLQQGGEETLESFNAKAVNPRTWNIPQYLLEFLLAAPHLIELEVGAKKIVITHALPSTHDLILYRSLGARPTKEELTAYRAACDNLIWNRDLEDSPEKNELWVSGHTPFTGIKRLRSKTVLQIDTGCCGPDRGPLTAWNPQEDRFFKAYPVKAPS